MDIHLNAASVLAVVGAIAAGIQLAMTRESPSLLWREQTPFEKSARKIALAAGVCAVAAGLAAAYVAGT